MMLWEDLIGHEQQREWFRTALQSERLASSFLFVGPVAIGKRTFARLLAKSLLCRRADPKMLAPCGKCEDCAQVDASTHPDLIQVSKPEDRAAMPIELLIGEREKRNREGLCHDISLKPYSGRRKVAILDDCDSLNVEGANCLLKTLEEPPAGSVLILIGTGLQRQLPTIRSRCQSIIFRPLDEPQMSQLLQRCGFADDEASGLELARRSEGNLTNAILLADEEFSEFRNKLLSSLANRQVDFANIAKSCGAMVDAAGKDTRAKRDRMLRLFLASAQLYRGVTLLEASDNGALPEKWRGDEVLLSSVNEIRQHWRGSVTAATKCWDRCLQAVEQVQRNANQTALLEAWAADLAALSSR
ncbi:MAG: DNA polymerase III subunit delta' [Aureliella sp.]